MGQCPQCVYDFYSLSGGPGECWTPAMASGAAAADVAAAAAAAAVASDGLLH